MSKYIEPPLGVAPSWYYIPRRIKDLSEAIVRYVEHYEKHLSSLDYKYERDMFECLQSWAKEVSLFCGVHVENIKNDWRQRAKARDLIMKRKKVTKYRKLPVEIEAMHFNGYNNLEIESWSKGAVISGPVLEPTENNPIGTYLQIKTLEGTMIAIVDDYIIKGVSGEFYPCKPDIFQKTYEAVE